jgi:hypothetical protein
LVIASEILPFYTAQSEITEPGQFASLYEVLPRAIPELARVGHGLMLHEHIAQAYGVTVQEERRREVHIRRNADRLAAIVAHDPRPLTEAREPGERLISNCRHYTVLMVSMLRSRGVPARSRCGFGSYFEAGKFVDHWVAEYWDTDRNSWRRIDAQVDDVQRKLFHSDFDVLDVPADRFIIAGDAWRMCRAGQADPAAFGIMDMNGLWFIAGNLVRDVAALNNVEALPWDAWGAMPQPGEAMDETRLAYFDELAALTHDPDAHFDELRRRYESDDGLRVPDTVLNAVLRRMEPF